MGSVAVKLVTLLEKFVVKSSSSEKVTAIEDSVF